jgi:hypothetical protein
MIPLLKVKRQSVMINSFLFIFYKIIFNLQLKGLAEKELAQHPKNNQNQRKIMTMRMK